MRGTVATLKTFERSQRTKNPDSNTSKVDEALLNLVLLSSFCNANEEGELKQKVIRKGGLTQLGGRPPNRIINNYCQGHTRTCRGNGN